MSASLPALTQKNLEMREKWKSYGVMANQLDAASMLVLWRLSVQVGDLVSWFSITGKPLVGVFLGYEGSSIHSYVFTKGRKLLFLTRELEVINESR
jgi:hypothetical protein